MKALFILGVKCLTVCSGDSSALLALSYSGVEALILRSGYKTVTGVTGLESVTGRGRGDDFLKESYC